MKERTQEVTKSEGEDERSLKMKDSRRGNPGWRRHRR